MARNIFVQDSLLTDFYEFTTAYALWKSRKHDENAVFEIFFRKNPFGGEFTIFAGLNECIDYIQNWKLTADDIDQLRDKLPGTIDPAFFDYLSHLDSSRLRVQAMEEGSVVFPKEPLIQVEGPLAVCQLLETTLLNLINYPSLIATNAARCRITAGPNCKLYEFGLRRAQGPNGGLTGSKYSYLGGFDATSNVLAGKLFNIKVIGTQPHSFITAFESPAETEESKLSDGRSSRKTGDGVVELPQRSLLSTTKPHVSGGETVDQIDDPGAVLSSIDLFLPRCLHWAARLESLLDNCYCRGYQLHKGELTAFANYALAFPDAFLVLVDTYDVLRSGLPNFCSVALALYECGKRATGVRIDSGDLAFLSNKIREAFRSIASHFNLDYFANLSIAASNDLDEETIDSLNQQGHSIDVFCLGTQLVTCGKQPALGSVYKLVQLQSRPVMKLSASVEKATLPGCKSVYRLFDRNGMALVDLLQHDNEHEPKINERILCRHPYEACKRVYVIPSSVEVKLKLYWDKGKLVRPIHTLDEARKKVLSELTTLRPDYKRSLNPTPFKVSLSEKLYTTTHQLWLDTIPIKHFT